MSWIKQVFTDFQTVITAAFLNDLQDQIIADETAVSGMVSGVKGNSENSYRHGNVNLTKANIGLGNVDNTSDAQKPVSNATQDALDSKVDKVTGKGLSANDYTTAEKQKVAASALQTDLDAVDDRVDQIYNGGVLYDITTGDIAAFADGADDMPMKALVATIEPVQDLHGYDHPWPAGGGKNIYSDSAISGTINGVTVTQNGSSYILNGTASAYTQFISNDIVTLSAGTYYFKTFGKTNDIYAQLRSLDGAITYASGASPFTLDSETEVKARIVVNSGTATNIVLNLMIVQGSDEPATFEPYSNICPISGWTGLTCARTGKNLLKNTATNTTIYGVTFTVNDDGTITASGTASSVVQYGFVFTLGAGSYIYSGCPSGGSNETYGCTLRESVGGSYISGITQDFGNGGTVSLESETTGYYNIRVAAGTVLNNLVFHPMIRLASETDDTFESYQGDTISVNWQSQAGTVYGGTVDIVTGKLTVDRATVDSGTLDWRKTTGASAQVVRFLTYSLVDVVKKVQNSTVANALCEMFKLASADQGYSGNVVDCITVDINGTISCYPTASYVDATAFQNAVSGIKFVYELATPQTYQLTPQEVTTLLGNNVVYTDVGPVSVTAPRDTKMYVDNKIAEAVAAALNA